MTPERLREIGVKLFGEWGWQTRLAERLLIDDRTVRRWVAGRVPVPGPAIVALELLEEKYDRTVKPKNKRKHEK
ncbi:MAG: hypothetical protein AAF346_13235 [Pseudomonadota bacterium]